MTIKELKTIVALRRSKIEDYNPQEVLQKGEVVFVDFRSGETKVKVGNGVDTFADLNFLEDNLEKEIKTTIIYGYFRNGEFFVKETGSEKYVGKTYKIYVDIPTKKAYLYDGASYNPFFDANYSQATDTTPGIMKLYQQEGNNIDGTMSQKSISSSLNSKVEMSVDKDSQTLFLKTIF